MPYVITTYAPTALPEVETEQSRRAFATLEEARSYMFRHVTSMPGYTTVIGFPTKPAIDALLPESGGTVGPLPDGTVIEVARVSEAALHNAIRSTLCCPTCGIQQGHVSGSHLIDAYNAAQGT